MLMEEPQQTQPNIKLTPGNRTIKGRRSKPMAEVRQTGKADPIAYIFDDPEAGVAFEVLNSANAWWVKPAEGNKDSGRVKLQKLVNAYKNYYTDEEAINYANISMDQLKYFQKLHPDFYTIKHGAKRRPDMTSKVTIVNQLGKDPHWAAWWLSRTQKDTFSTRIEATGANGRDLIDGLTQQVREMLEDDEEENDDDNNQDQEHAGVDDAGNSDAGQDRPGHEAVPAGAQPQGEAQNP